MSRLDLIWNQELIFLFTAYSDKIYGTIINQYLSDCKRT